VADARLVTVALHLWIKGVGEFIGEISASRPRFAWKRWSGRTAGNRGAFDDLNVVIR
jgi:hypothetical protein